MDKPINNGFSNTELHNKNKENLLSQEEADNDEHLLTKEEIVANWLPRNTNTNLEDFGKHILLVNFKHYVHAFADMFGVPVKGEHKNMQTATYDDITIINYGVGSPNAALILDLLTAIKPRCAIFLGKCGGLKHKLKPGSFIVPMGAIRGEGTSDYYFRKEVPALPSFAMQRSISHVLKQNARDYYDGVVYSTNIRVWEHDSNFRQMLKEVNASVIDMETATMFIVAFANEIPIGALHLVSDQPIYRSGIKSEESDKLITANFANEHLKLGIESLQQIKNHGESLKHFQW